MVKYFTRLSTKYVDKYQVKPAFDEFARLVCVGIFAMEIKIASSYVKNVHLCSWKISKNTIITKPNRMANKIVIAMSSKFCKMWSYLKSTDDLHFIRFCAVTISNFIPYVLLFERSLNVSALIKLTTKLVLCSCTNLVYNTTFSSNTAFMDNLLSIIFLCKTSYKAVITITKSLYFQSCHWQIENYER